MSLHDLQTAVNTGSYSTSSNDPSQISNRPSSLNREQVRAAIPPSVKYNSTINSQQIMPFSHLL